MNKNHKSINPHSKSPILEHRLFNIRIKLYWILLFVILAFFMGNLFNAVISSSEQPIISCPKQICQCPEIKIDRIKIDSEDIISDCVKIIQNIKTLEKSMELK